MCHCVTSLILAQALLLSYKIKAEKIQRLHRGTDTLFICLKKQRVNWTRSPVTSKATRTWCGRSWNVSEIVLFLEPVGGWSCLRFFFLFFYDITTLFSTAMEQSMPKDDAANRCTVDFRIQKTQVSKHGADHSYTSHPPAKWKWLLQH